MLLAAKKCKREINNALRNSPSNLLFLTQKRKRRSPANSQSSSRRFPVGKINNKLDFCLLKAKNLNRRCELPQFDSAAGLSYYQRHLQSVSDSRTVVCIAPRQWILCKQTNKINIKGEWATRDDYDRVLHDMRVWVWTWCSMQQLFCLSLRKGRWSLRFVQTKVWLDNRLINKFKLDWPGLASK